jgi:hypothetical protein
MVDEQGAGMGCRYSRDGRVMRIPLWVVVAGWDLRGALSYVVEPKECVGSEDGNKSMWRMSWDLLVTSQRGRV